MSFETDFDSAFTILLGKAQGTLTHDPAPTPTPVSSGGGETVVTSSRVVDIPFVIGSSSVPLTGGELAFLRLGLNGLVGISNWSMATMIAGIPANATCTVDVRAGATITGATSICGGNPPTYTGVSELPDQPVNGWSSNLPDPVWLVATVTAVDGRVEIIGLTLRAVVTFVGATSIFVADESGNTLTDENGDPLTE